MRTYAIAVIILVLGLIAMTATIALIALQAVTP